jgi:hypothetical protein
MKTRACARHACMRAHTSVRRRGSNPGTIEEGSALLLIRRANISGSLALSVCLKRISFVQLGSRVFAAKQALEIEGKPRPSLLTLIPRRDENGTSRTPQRNQLARDLGLVCM